MLIDSKGTEITVNLEGSKFSRIAIFEDFIEIILRIHCLNHAHAAHVSIAPECCPSALLHENCGSRWASDYMCGHMIMTVPLQSASTQN